MDLRLQPDFSSEFIPLAGPVLSLSHLSVSAGEQTPENVTISRSITSGSRVDREGAGACDVAGRSGSRFDFRLQRAHRNYGHSQSASRYFVEK